MRGMETFLYYSFEQSPSSLNEEIIPWIDKSTYVYKAQEMKGKKISTHLFLDFKLNKNTYSDRY